MSDESPIFSEAQEAKLREMIVNATNGAVQSMKKHVADRAKADAESLGKLLDEKLSSFKPQQPTGDQEPEGGSKQSKKDLELAAMRKSLEDLRTQSEQAQLRAQRERDKNIENATRTAVFEALGEHGVDLARARIAFAAFKYENRIESQIDEDSDELSVLFRDDDGTQTPLRDGIKRWVKTEGAKIFLPPSGARGGSGSRPSSPSSQGGKPDPAAVKSRLAEAIERVI